MSVASYVWSNTVGGRRVASSELGAFGFAPSAGLRAGSRGTDECVRRLGGYDGYRMGSFLDGAKYFSLGIWGVGLQVWELGLGGSNP
jgi:hypothetical protein